MRSIETSIIIEAPKDKVWSVLTDFERYPQWNPFIKSLTGVTEVGNTISATIQPPESGAMTFKPTVLVFDNEKEFRWKGKLLIKGLFDGEHFFILKDNGNGSTEFIQGEQFGGILVGLLSKALVKTEEGFNLMNEALKKECEG